MALSLMPIEVLENILSNLDSKTLVKSCRRVCQAWRDLVDNDILLRRSLPSPRLRQAFQGKNLTFKEYYMIEKYFGKNLLQNPNFLPQQANIVSAFVQSIISPRESGAVPGWSSRGPFVRESPSVGTNCSIPDFVLRKNGYSKMQDLPVIATSYSETMQFQDVVLADCGINDTVMDIVQPTIYAEEWIGTRFDCGNVYTLTVELFKKGQNSPCHWKRVHVNTLPEGSWKKVSLSVKNYGPGVRRLRFKRRGKDNQFWAGFYGTKFAFPSLSLHLPTV